jgi:hypothetical protein
MALTDGEEQLLSSNLPLDALDQLVRLHAESRQTDRMARFLAAAAHAAFLFMTMTVVMLFLEGASLAQDFVWAGMILIGVLALLRCHIRAHAALFSERPFMAPAKELRLLFFYMGIAWGAGAFLVMPVDAGTGAVVLFMFLPGSILAFLVPDSMGFICFLLPMSITVIGAALLRGFPHAGLDMSLILILQWGLFSGAFLRNREPSPAALNPGRSLARG